MDAAVTDIAADAVRPVGAVDEIAVPAQMEGVIAERIVGTVRHRRGQVGDAHANVMKALAALGYELGYGRIFRGRLQQL